METAGHLFGIAAECALKATLERAGIPLDRASGLRVHIPDLLTTILLSGFTRHMTGLLSILSSLSSLIIECPIHTRYAAAGSIDGGRCQNWQSETETVLMACGFSI